MSPPGFSRAIWSRTGSCCPSARGWPRASDGSVFTCPASALFAISSFLVRIGAEPRHARVFPHSAGGRRRRLAAERTGDPCGYLSRRQSAEWRSRFTAWRWWWRPAIGPTLGGWITDNYSWRWIFYINVPISILSLYLTHRLVEDPPYLRVEQERRRGVRIDYVGLGLIALAVGCLQMVLDKGQELDWFGPTGSYVGVCLAIVVFVSWIIWEWRHPNPIVELKLLKNRNLATAVGLHVYPGLRAVRHHGADSPISSDC